MKGRCLIWALCGGERGDEGVRTVQGNRFWCIGIGGLL